MKKYSSYTKKRLLLAAEQSQEQEWRLFEDDGCHMLYRLTQNGMEEDRQLDKEWARG